ncbi:MAG TPA: metallophosphoesterase family protein [Sphingomicrobium sp.]|nr:metallophosphoesterase family protein [Sphingomicrobium sp.]
MRVAAISDIHGNLDALEAVLADIARRGADLIVNLGDIVSGPLQPVETAERLMALDLPTIRGNHERQLLTLARDSMGESDAFAHKRLTPLQRQWLASLPATLTLEGIFLCHGTPQSDVGYFLHTVEPETVRPASSAEVRERAAGRREGLILCGHTHLPAVRRLGDGQLVVNPGSVGLQAYRDERPYPHIVENGSPHARYAIAERDRDGVWRAELLEVDYCWRMPAWLASEHGRLDWVHALRTGRLPASLCDGEQE